MASTFMGDICVSIGRYKDKDGNEKDRMAKVGAWFQNDKGSITGKIDLVPIGHDDSQSGGFWIKLFHQQNNNQNVDQGQQQQQQNNRPPQGNQQQGNQRPPQNNNNNRGGNGGYTG